MKLLIISNNPDRASFRQRIGVYLDTLQGNGIRCEVAKLPATERARLNLFRRAAGYDAVYLHKKCLNILDAFFLRKYSRKIIYNYDDAVMYSEKHPERGSFFRMLSFCRTAKMADCIVVGSSYLSRQGQPYNDSIHVLPLGLEVKRYDVSRINIDDAKVRLVWIGSKSTAGYIQALSDVLEQIALQCGNVIIRIISDGFPQLRNLPVEKIPWDVHSRYGALAECDIGLAPLPDNRFTQGKCSFKVLEYSATGLAVVGSPVGSNVDHIREGVTGFFASDAKQWTQKILLLIKDKQLRSEMGRAGKIFARQFDCEIIGDRLSVLIKNILQQ
jgi:glycosyltransferase involved in cell wall biosynthesis